VVRASIGDRSVDARSNTQVDAFGDRLAFVEEVRSSPKRPWELHSSSAGRVLPRVFSRRKFLQMGDLLRVLFPSCPLTKRKISMGVFLLLLVTLCKFWHFLIQEVLAERDFVRTELLVRMKAGIPRKPGCRPCPRPSQHPGRFFAGVEGQGVDAQIAGFSRDGDGSR